MNEKPDECHRCDFPTVDLLLFGDGDYSEWLCDLCASTYTSRSDPGYTSVRSMCYIGNVILKAIREK